MTDQQLALQAINEAQLMLEDYLRPGRRAMSVSSTATKQPRSAQMSKLPSIALTAWIATLLSVGIPNAQAKQQCSAAAPKNPHGQWWSYRLIDGRKCWYEGKPLLSKSLLE